MLRAFGLAALLWAASCALTAAHPCLCSAVLPAGQRVNCSSLGLLDVPLLPPDTTELHVQDNRLTSVPPGLFDRLVGLKKASLSGNPFHCDCSIQYLRDWLLSNRAAVSKQPTCATPSIVAQKVISELSDEYFSSCRPAGCDPGAYHLTVGAMLCCLLALLAWSLRLAKTSTFTLFIQERQGALEAGSLRSLKPKHRRRLLHTEDLEKPRVSMELLPQVLDVLHKKHNIKIKAT